MIQFLQNTSLTASSELLFNTRINKWIELTPTKTLLYIILFPAHSLTLLNNFLKQKDINSPMEHNKSYSNTNIHCYISSILAIFKHTPHLISHIPNIFTLHSLWITIRDTNQSSIVERRNKHIPTQLQATKGGTSLTFKDIIDKRNSSNIDIIDKLLLAMYTDIYPVRLDYFATEIIYNGSLPSTDNYIIIHPEHAELIIRKFKTSKIHNPIHYDKLPNSLFILILDSLRIMPRKFLFERDGKPFTSNSFCKWSSARLQSLFGTSITLTIIRHLFTNTLDMNTPICELRRIANLMGHTTGIQKLYKWLPC